MHNARKNISSFVVVVRKFINFAIAQEEMLNQVLTFPLLTVATSLGGVDEGGTDCIRADEGRDGSRLV